MISSVANPRIKRVRRLRKRSHRETRGRVLVEGHRAILPALDAGAIDELLYANGSGSSAIVTRARAEGVTTTEVSRTVMAHLTAASSAPGVLAIARMPSNVPPAVPGMLLLGVRDPATEGALIALAAATGLEGVSVGPGCTDPYAPKVLRAAGGAHFVIRVGSEDEPGAALDRARSAGATVLRLVDGGPPAWERALPPSLTLIVGDDPLPDGDADVGVPSVGTAAPLTLRAAAVLYEWVRQMGGTR